MNKTLVTPKINPDLDGTSCALAYAYLLNEHGPYAEGLVFGAPQSEVSYFVEQHGISVPTRSEECTDGWTHFVLVDASSTKGMPGAVIPEQVVEIIDHRAGGSPEKEFPNATIQNELIGAAATLVTERFMKQGLHPLPDHAKLLYGAIYHNSLNFLSSNTHRRDREAALFLETAFGLSPTIPREMFDYATQRIEADVYRALEDDAKEFGRGYTIGAFQLIVAGANILKQRGVLEEATQNLSKEMEADWSFLNIVDIERGGSVLYVTDKKGTAPLENILNTSFDHGWTTLPTVWLRKQITAHLSKQ